MFHVQPETACPPVLKVDNLVTQKPRLWARALQAAVVQLLIGNMSQMTHEERAKVLC